MLFISLFFSGILLFVANLAVRTSSWPFTIILATGLVMSLVTCVFFSVAVPLLTALFCLILWLCPARFLPLSVLSLVAVYGLLAVPGIQRERDYRIWRAQYPFESVEDRLPFMEVDRTGPKPNFDEAQLQRVEAEIEGDYVPRERSHQLKRLHEYAIDMFVSSPGFGITRMGSSPLNLIEGVRNEKDIPQPAAPSVGGLRSIDVTTPAVGSNLRMHQNSIIDFVNPVGWGYFKSRSKVAGFQSHQFSKVPEPAGPLRITSIELIGWLHGEPLAYVSENLPAMKELRKAATRPLDSFESDGLKQLREGQGSVYSERARSGASAGRYPGRQAMP
jgi:hypothetical protein